VDFDAVPPERERRGIPRLPRVYIPRPQLWEQLESATLEPMTLLVAPGGAGKTLGVGGWVRTRTSPGVDDPIWVQGSETLVAQDLRRLVEQSASSTQGGAPRLVIVDDAQALPSAALRALDARLSDDPASMRMLLLSRWDLPLTRLVPELLGNFTTIRGETLRLTDAESAALVIEHARTSDREVIRLVTERAQGWCAAVVLAARTVAGSADPRAAAVILASHTAPVVDRVASEVFATLQRRQRHLLLCVAGEGLVSVSTAAHLSRDPGAGDVFAELETTGLLVTRVDVRHFDATHAEELDGDVQYRIHPLLAEVIRRRLVAGGVDVAQAKATVVRAVALDVARDHVRDALRRLVAVGAVTEAADLLSQHGVRLVLAESHRHEVLEFTRAHPEIVGVRPDLWFALALERWISNDTTSARHWADRIVAEDFPPDVTCPARLACVRLWRALLGLEPFYAAIGNAKRVVLAERDAATPKDDLDSAMPILLNELGVAQNWLGDLAEAESNLTLAVTQCRSRGMSGFALTALTHLALTEYMAGREHACVGLASEALEIMDNERQASSTFSPSRAGLALTLGQIVDVPHQLQDTVVPDAEARVHHGDLTAQFWSRIRDARLELIGGSAAKAERVLATPADYAELVEVALPDHLRSAMLVERAFVAALSSDRETLKVLGEQLTSIQARGEAALVDGLRADIDGDRRLAATSFERAAADAVYSQPPTRAMALACEAQMLDALGEPALAQERLRTAVTETEVRRNAAPFVGWTHQGTPMRVLMERLDEGNESGWSHELLGMLDQLPDMVSVFRPMTPTPRERSSSVRVMVRPILSPREREVLSELARGSTYADIAATLFVSENTVKTHISSLYGKLAVSRRSEALSVGRSLGLI
jgi:ATP/maltotriose-dependent transcriptional regulator MalT